MSVRTFKLMSMHREWTWNIYSLHKFYETPNFYGLQIIRQCPTKLAHIRRNHICGRTQFPANRWISLWKWLKYTLSNCELSYQQSNIISVNKTVIGLTLQTSYIPNTVLTEEALRLLDLHWPQFCFFPIKVASWPAKCSSVKSNYLQPWIFKGNP